MFLYIHHYFSVAARLGMLLETFKPFLPIVIAITYDALSTCYPVTDSFFGNTYSHNRTPSALLNIRLSNQGYILYHSGWNCLHFLPWSFLLCDMTFTMDTCST